MPLRPNFSGAWEKDFRRSDNWETELNRVIRVRREALERQRRGNSREPIISTGSSASAGNGRSANLVNLARLAEYITRQNTLSIVQNREEIRIQRENEGDLACGLGNDSMQPFSSEHGSEICGWDRQQLVFSIILPEQLIITHRFDVASDGSTLNMLLTLSSGSESFSLIQVYSKYEAPEESFNCVQTISRGRVCSQVTPLP